MINNNSDALATPIIILLFYTVGHNCLLVYWTASWCPPQYNQNCNPLWTSTARTPISPQPTDIPLLQMKDGKRLFPLTSNILMLLICLRFGSEKKLQVSQQWDTICSHSLVQHDLGKAGQTDFPTDICIFDMQVWTFLVKYCEISTFLCYWLF